MNYYIDPKTDDLIIYDPEENEIRVVKLIEETEYEEENKETGPEPAPKKPEEKKTRPCKIDDKTIGKIRSMRRQGLSRKDIVVKLGISYMTVHKYLQDYDDGKLEASKPDSSPKDKGGFKEFPGEENQRENEDDAEKGEE